jgi:predicted TPR repeat methyltransferase
MGEGEHAAAGERYAAASALVPDNAELLFWAGLATAQRGDLDGGTDAVRRSIALNPRLARLLERLEPDVAPAAEQVRAALGARRGPG